MRRTRIDYLRGALPALPPVAFPLNVIMAFQVSYGRSVSPESLKICPEASMTRHAFKGHESGGHGSGGMQAMIFLRLGTD
jgi:hypothetical protein